MERVRRAAVRRFNGWTTPFADIGWEMAAYAPDARFGVAVRWCGTAPEKPLAVTPASGSIVAPSISPTSVSLPLNAQRPP